MCLGIFAGKKSNKSRTVISVVVPSVASVVLIISLGVYSRVKKNKANGQKVEGKYIRIHLKFVFTVIRSS